VAKSTVKYTLTWDEASYDEFIRHNRLQDMVQNISKTVTAGNIDETCNQDRLMQLREKN